jgi:poly(3-hydroxybutyrate) depolymerase
MTLRMTDATDPPLLAGRTFRASRKYRSVSDGVRQWGLRYRAHNKVLRWAVVVVPAQYGPEHPSPSLPLVISPHGRGVRARTNANLWSDLPGQGGFAVICPGGMGRRLPLHSWGWRGQIDDLARMPDILRGARPWLRIDAERTYAVGGSMGGQETLLLVGRHPRLLAGAVAFDSVTDFFRRYSDFALLGRKGTALQALARIEVGGTPKTNPSEYRLRSPQHWLDEIAGSGVPLQIWWSDVDEIVTGQENQSGRFFADLQALKPRGRLEKVTGSWSHTAESYRRLELPAAVRWLGLLSQV